MAAGPGDRGYTRAVLRADGLVEVTQRLAARSLQRLRPATKAEFAELFPDCELGTMPRFGNRCGLPANVDSAAAGEEALAIVIFQSLNEPESGVYCHGF